MKEVAGSSPAPSTIKKNIFSKSIEKYYTRQGNRIVFKNGQSLNALALSMWEQLDYSEIDASVLSRVLSGERLFTQKQLKIFCNLQSLNSKEKENLKEALFFDLLERFELSETFFDISRKYFIDYLKKDLGRIWDIRSAGQSILGLGWSNFLIEQIETKISLLKDGSSQSTEFSMLYIDALFQKSILICDMATPKNVVRLSIPIIKKIRSIGNKLKNQEILNIANCRLGSTYHIKGESQKALALLSSGHNMDNNIPVQALSYRESLINLGRLNKLKEYESLKKIVEEKLENYPLAYRSPFYEGLARAENDLGRLSKAVHYLEKAELNKKYTNNLGNKYIQNIQLTKIKLQIQKKHPNTFTNSFLDREIQKSLAYAHEYGLKRYEDAISQISEQIF